MSIPLNLDAEKFAAEDDAQCTRPTFYVQSGNMRQVVEASGEAEAIRIAIKAVRGQGNVSLGQIYRVSKTGFDSNAEDDIIGLTAYLIRQLSKDDDFARVAIKMNVFQGRESCAVCEVETTADLGLQLFEADSWRPICRDCGKKLAPEMVTLLALAQAASDFSDESPEFGSEC